MGPGRCLPEVQTGEKIKRRHKRLESSIRSRGSSQKKLRNGKWNRYEMG